ncbi:MAG: MBL fold metallo-hydrolase [Dehalococcoidia bacterium]|nr:MBL fold metallo-hydrolase [Dehalococcoidia bacterium]
MWYRTPARIGDNIHFLGTHELCHYLIRGEVGMIVGGGMNHGTPELERQFDEMNIDPVAVKYAVVTHSHFDHIGAIPYLRNRFPGIQVLGTAAAQHALAKPKVVDYNAKMNDVAAAQLGLDAECTRLEGLSPEAFAVDRVVTDGEIIDLGAGVTAEFLEVPGHSKCCVATYVPGARALFPTDTTPHPVAEWNDLAFPSAQYDFAKYVASLRRLNTLDVDLVGLDHHGVMQGEHAGRFLELGLQRTLELQKDVLEQYSLSGDIDAISRKVSEEALKKVSLPFIDGELMFIITRAMIKSIVSSS